MENEVGPVKKRSGVIPCRGVTPEWNQEKWSQSDSDDSDEQKCQFCEEKNSGDTVELTDGDDRKKVVRFFWKIGVAPSVAALGDTNPSDAPDYTGRKGRGEREARR